MVEPTKSRWRYLWNEVEEETTILERGREDIASEVLLDQLG
jgi:hypothetical protein